VQPPIQQVLYWRHFGDSNLVLIIIINGLIGWFFGCSQAGDKISSPPFALAPLLSAVARRWLLWLKGARLWARFAYASAG